MVVSNCPLSVLREVQFHYEIKKALEAVSSVPINKLAPSSSIFCMSDLTSVPPTRSTGLISGSDDINGCATWNTCDDNSLVGDMITPRTWAVSRTCVAPLETSRVHLMVGSSRHSTTEVSQDIMQIRGWTGLFRGNLSMSFVLLQAKQLSYNFDVALFAYDIVKKCLAPKDGEKPKPRIPESLM
ncbi:adenine nucleotide transporter BT1, chloroplastic/mitochondrial-like protein [Tanacetum coccineum]